MLAFVVLAWLGSPGAAADADDSRPAPASDDSSRVLAGVDGIPITLAEVRLELKATLRERDPEAADEPQLVQAMLEQIVRRRLALAALIAGGRAASEGQVDRALKARNAQLEARGESLHEFLGTNGIPLDSYRRRLHWELSWDAYKDEMLTAENLEQFFARHRRHFDGTEVRASHVLLRSAEFGMRNPGQISDPKSQIPNSVDEAALAQVREIRAAIEAGDLKFAEAAAKYSAAPSRDRGGDVGYFPRRGVMHENFAAAAFRLKPGEVSPPVVTPFGVHLIQVTDEKPGAKQFTEVHDEVYRAAEGRLFETLVAEGGQHARIERADGR